MPTKKLCSSFSRKAPELIAGTNMVTLRWIFFSHVIAFTLIDPPGTRNHVTYTTLDEHRRKKGCAR